MFLESQQAIRTDHVIPAAFIPTLRTLLLCSKRQSRQDSRIQQESARTEQPEQDSPQQRGKNNNDRRIFFYCCMQEELWILYIYLIRMMIKGSASVLTVIQYPDMEAKKMSFPVVLDPSRCFAVRQLPRTTGSIACSLLSCQGLQYSSRTVLLYRQCGLCCEYPFCGVIRRLKTSCDLCIRRLQR